MTQPSDVPAPAPPPVPVVAVVLTREGRYLVGRRPRHKRHGGLWEFPGGKLDPGETLAMAAARELREELDLAIEAVGNVLVGYRDPGSAFEIVFVEAVAAGDPVALEHEELGWFTPTELLALPLAPTDARFVREMLGEEP